MSNSEYNLSSKNVSTISWKVYNMDGKLMFVTGKKKVDWYLKKGLAKKIKGSEPSIRLNFETKGNGYENDDLFGLSERKPVCVVSGKDIRNANGEYGLQKHHVVPYCYRKWFRDEYKSKNHHDVLLVTDEIHRNYEYHATNYKDNMAEKYGVRTIVDLNGEYSRMLTDFSKKQVKVLSSLSALIHSFNQIPKSKIISTLNFISEVSGIKRDFLYGLNMIQLYKFYRLISDDRHNNIVALKKQNKPEYDHGFQVVSKLDTHEKIEEFVRMWRTHFVETTNPQHLPIGWSINYKVKVDLI